jgi:nitrogen-specific signal transduction histidine kinase
MPFTLHSSLISIPLRALPIAAAAVDPNRMIVAANGRFVRLSKQGPSSGDRPRLEDIVAEPDKAAVAEVLNVLTLLGGQGPQRRRIRARRATPPALWLDFQITRLGADSAVPYLVCVQPTSKRRRIDSPPERTDPIRVVAEMEFGLPLATTLSHDMRGQLTTILGWAQMAERGVLTPERMSWALRVIGRNAARLSDMIERFDLLWSSSGDNGRLTEVTTGDAARATAEAATQDRSAVGKAIR